MRARRARTFSRERDEIASVTRDLKAAVAEVKRLYDRAPAKTTPHRSSPSRSRGGFDCPSPGRVPMPFSFHFEGCGSPKSSSRTPTSRSNGPKSTPKASLSPSSPQRLTTRAQTPQPTEGTNKIDKSKVVNKDAANMEKETQRATEIALRLASELQIVASRESKIR